MKKLEAVKDNDGKHSLTHWFIKQFFSKKQLSDLDGGGGGGGGSAGDDDNPKE